MSEVTYKRITWAHRLLFWPIIFLVVIVPIFRYENEIRSILKPPPFETLSARGEMMPSGRWRVTYRFLVREQCRSVTWRKGFRFEGEREDLLVDAVASSRPAARGAVISGGSSPPGPTEFWLEYDSLPGRQGAFLVSGSFADCPSGYQDILTLPPVAVDWTAVR